MEIQTWTRKEFNVEVVQIDFSNIQEVAEWCGGTVGRTSVKMMGRDTELPCIVLQGTGPYKGKSFTAQLGDWIVGRNGSFRVNTEKQFKASFYKKQEPYVLGEGERETRIYQTSMVDPKTLPGHSPLENAVRITAHGDSWVEESKEDDVNEVAELFAEAPDSKRVEGIVESIMSGEMGTTDGVYELNDWVRVKARGDWYMLTGFVEGFGAHGLVKVRFEQVDSNYFHQDELEKYSDTLVSSGE